MSKTPPEGYVYDGEHLVEEGLGTWHVVYAENGGAKGAIWMPFPLPELETTQEEKAAIAAAKRGKRRRRKR